MPGPLTTVRRRWDRPVDPRPLAVARIGVGVAALLVFTEQYFRLSSIAEGDLALPGTGFLPGVTSVSVTVYAFVAVCASAALVLGVGARAGAAGITACAWFGFAWEQQTYSNHMVLTAWLALWLALVPCDAAWSLTSRDRGRGEVRWGDQVLLMSQLSVCYLFAALVKLHPGFLSGDALRGFVDLDVDLPDQAWTLLACGAVATELGLAVGLWLPRVRWLVAPAGALLHGSIVVAMWADAWALVAFSVACLSQYPLFLAGRPRLPVEPGTAASAEPVPSETGAPA